MSVGGYMGKLLRVDLSDGTMTEDSLDEATLRKYLGGTGIGAKILYDEVPPGVEWSDPENRLILASGPISGTMRGTGTVSVVTKGPMTNGAVSSQAGGFMGAYMKFSGFDAIVVRGAAQRPVYLYLHDGVAELRDASRLVGEDTWRTEDLIREELGKGERQLSVLGIGPAGEHLVRFAAIVGDHGHVVAHGGAGAVMGSKNLKAIAAERGKAEVRVADRERLRQLNKEIYEEIRALPVNVVGWGTSLYLTTLFEDKGLLPVRNYNAKRFAGSESFQSSSYRARYEVKITPCWGCNFKHCAQVKIKEGPYAGFVGEEPEYEGLAAFGALTMQPDVDAAVVLCNEVDRYGMDINETGWIMGWLMECHEKGLITGKDADGVEMAWGDVEAMRKMLRKIAYREGFGDVLAEGAMRAATRVGGEAFNLAIFTKKGNTPLTHDHRGSWQMLLDTCTSSTGADEAGVLLARPESLGLPSELDVFSAEGAARMLAAGEGMMPFVDSLVICRLTLYGATPFRHCQILNAVTGWGFTVQEAQEVGRRIVNLLKCFNVRHGHTPDMDRPSPKYGSAPTEGPGAGRAFYDVFDEAVRLYYEGMGWDKETGKPLTSTLEELGLGHAANDIWGGSVNVDELPVGTIPRP